MSINHHFYTPFLLGEKAARLAMAFNARVVVNKTGPGEYEAYLQGAMLQSVNALGEEGEPIIGYARVASEGERGCPAVRRAYREHAIEDLVKKAGWADRLRVTSLPSGASRDYINTSACPSRLERIAALFRPHYSVE